MAKTGVDRVIPTLAAIAAILMSILMYVNEVWLLFGGALVLAALGVGVQLEYEIKHGYWSDA